MTPAEQIAYLRRWDGAHGSPWEAIGAVCDLAERALLDDDDETEAVRAVLAAAALLADAAAAMCSTAQPAEMSWRVSPEAMVDLVRTHTEYDYAADCAKSVLRRLLGE